MACVVDRSCRLRGVSSQVTLTVLRKPTEEAIFNHLGMPQDFVLYELVLEGYPVYAITRGDDALRGKMGLRTDHGELFIQGVVLIIEAEPFVPIISLIRQRLFYY